MPGEWHDLENGGEYSIAGWQSESSQWHDVEDGDTPLEDSLYDLADMEIVVFHYHDEAGNDTYFTVYGPWDDEDSFESIIDDTLDHYGVE